MSRPEEFCEHENMHTELVTTNYINSSGDPDQYDTVVYVCDDCDETIDPDVADPALDRQEAEAEYYADWPDYSYSRDCRRDK